MMILVTKNDDDGDYNEEDANEDFENLKNMFHKIWCYDCREIPVQLGQQQELPLLRTCSGEENTILRLEIENQNSQT